MTVLQALAILEGATLEWKKRNINTPEVSDALDLLEPYIWPKWLVLQFRMALCRGGDGELTWKINRSYFARLSLAYEIQSACCSKYEWMQWLVNSMRHTT